MELPNDRTRFTDNKPGKGLQFREHYFDCQHHPVMIDETKLNTQASTVISHNESLMFEGLMNSLRVSSNDTWRIMLSEAARSGCEALKPHVRKSCTKTKSKGFTRREIQHKIFLTTVEKQQLKSLSKELNLTAKETIRACLIWLSQGIKKLNILELTDTPKLDDNDTRKIVDQKLKAKGSDYVKKDISNLTSSNKESYDQGELDNLESIRDWNEYRSAALMEMDAGTRYQCFDEYGDPINERIDNWIRLNYFPESFDEETDEPNLSDTMSDDDMDKLLAECKELIDELHEGLEETPKKVLQVPVSRKFLDYQDQQDELAPYADSVDSWGC